MRRGGFVLAGGRSSRMGRDKALLPWAGQTVLAAVLRAVEQAAGQVILIAPARRYPSPGCPVIPDLRPGLGPLAGLETALSVTGDEWNLVVACDMPRLTAPLLARLLADAAACDADCLIPTTPNGSHPLAAVYHRRCLPAVSRALDEGNLRLLDALARVRSAPWPVPPADEPQFANLNTADQWRALLQSEQKGP